MSKKNVQLYSWHALQFHGAGNSSEGNFLFFIFICNICRHYLYVFASQYFHPFTLNWWSELLHIGCTYKTVEDLVKLTQIIHLLISEAAKQTKKTFKIDFIHVQIYKWDKWWLTGVVLLEKKTWKKRIFSSFSALL